jgi:hypothetical protein
MGARVMERLTERESFSRSIMKERERVSEATRFWERRSLFIASNKIWPLGLPRTDYPPPNMKNPGTIHGLAPKSS